MKKKEEKYFLELFRKHYQKFPEGEIKDDESPDFLIIDNDKIIGIELTKIFQKNHSERMTFQASDSIIRDILLRIRKQFESKKLLGYEIHLDFHIDHNSIKEKREEIANKLFNVIIENLPKQNGWVEIQNDFENLEKFPEIVSRISVYYSTELEILNITDSKGGWIQHNMIEDLQEVISRKNSKVQNYLRKCHEIWLLVHTISFSSGLFYIPGEETLNHIYHSNFDDIFFLNSSDREVHKLKNNAT